MFDRLAIHGLQYLGYGLEIVLLGFLLIRGRWKDITSLFLYVTGYVIIDAVLRPGVLNYYGFKSVQYQYCYWITDVALTLGAFLLIAAFFRRVCKAKRETWSMVRSMLAAVFVLIAVISYFALINHYDHLFSRFIVEFQQNLYFACLVLNTLLYIVLQQTDSANEELSFLVLGLGIEFAGSAASMALMYLTPGGQDAGILAAFAAQICNLGMFLTWFYAITQATKKKTVPSYGDSRQVPALADAPIRGTR
ncbi:MAG TPA: hypothetical protein VFZ08_04810 [Terriglobia bacterium]|nr:hypothetical protein [Terriglobia bacterium]